MNHWTPQLLPKLNRVHSLCSELWMSYQIDYDEGEKHFQFSATAGGEKDLLLTKDYSSLESVLDLAIEALENRLTRSQTQTDY